MIYGYPSHLNSIWSDNTMIAAPWLVYSLLQKSIQPAVCLKCAEISRLIKGQVTEKFNRVWPNVIKTCGEPWLVCPLNFMSIWSALVCKYTDNALPIKGQGMAAFQRSVLKCLSGVRGPILTFQTKFYVHIISWLLAFALNHCCS